MRGLSCQDHELAETRWSGITLGLAAGSVLVAGLVMRSVPVLAYGPRIQVCAGNVWDQVSLSQLAASSPGGQICD